MSRHSAPYRILPLPGYAPNIGRLVAMLSYARQTTLALVVPASLHCDGSTVG